MVVDVHLNGAYNVSARPITHFREQNEGSYVLFTSTSGLIGNIGQANYAAAKMGDRRPVAHHRDGGRRPRMSAPMSSRPSPGRA